MPEILDDKSECCISFIISCLKSSGGDEETPLFVGLNGPQGSGKTTLFVNEALQGYDQLTDQIDAIIHLDAEDPINVYRWRMQQEVALRQVKGSGMTDEQVIQFVNGYYPAYELFTDNLRAGVFGGAKGKQLRLIIGEDRKVKEVVMI
ncbi:D-glycerate 3-kinase, partial [Lecanoromycetidae sp. Uapishka_2]